MRAIDVHGFGGCFALGVVRAGFDLIAKRENDAGFGVAMMEGNRHLLGEFEVEARDPSQWSPRSAELVFGNPPCSGFSGLSVSVNVGGQRQDWRKTATINNCMMDLVTYAAKCDPRVVIFESVQGAYTRGIDWMRQLHATLEGLTADEWQLTHVLQNDLSLGGFSMRKRYFWVATRGNMPMHVLTPPPLQRTLTLRDCIGDLEPLALGDMEGHEVLNTPRTWRLSWLADNAEWNAGEFSGAAFARLPDGIELPSNWFNKKGHLIAGGEITQCLYSPRRMNYDKPAPVVAGHALVELVHPTLSRPVTHRELARMMNLPDEWRCEPAMRNSKGQFVWGKQIPVTPGQWIADSAMQHLENYVDFGHNDYIKPDEVGTREWKVDITNAWKSVG